MTRGTAIAAEGRDLGTLAPSKSRRLTPRPSASRRSVALVAAVVVLAAACAASLAIGARGLPLATIWEAITNYNPGDGSHAVVIARIPRTVLGLLAGAALGLAGVTMQGVARNPFAHHGVHGLTAGAALA